MIHITKNTKKKRDEIRKSAEQYFGEGGLGLDPATQTTCSLCFQGGGGYVSVNIIDKEMDRIVDIESREWEYHAKTFLRQI